MAYEAAVEAISEAVGAYSALIAAEEAKERPDPRVLARARAGQSECARSRERHGPALAWNKHPAREPDIELEAGA